MEQNIIFNPNFKLGLRGWHGNTCTLYPSRQYHDSKGEKLEEEPICIVTNRKETWQGLEQELSAHVKPNVKYNVTVILRVSNNLQTHAEVRATLRMESPGSATKYLPVGKVIASSCNDWTKLNGSFSLNAIPKKAIFYIEGPSAGIDILVKYVDIRPQGVSKERDESLRKIFTEKFHLDSLELVIKNPNFEQGLQNWYGKGCTISLLDSGHSGRNSKSKGDCCAVASKRTSGWQGIEQEVTGLLKPNKKYEVSATVKIRGAVPSAEVLATLWVKDEAQRDKYITLGKVIASSTSWVTLKGSLLLNKKPTKACAYIEGPPAGIDLLVDSFSIFSIIKPPPVRPSFEDANFGENIVENPNFSSGICGWSSLGSCCLAIETGAPLVLPPAARDTLKMDLPVTGKFVVAKNRRHDWEGPSQMITEKIKLFVPYQVSAWVRIGRGGVGLQKVNVALGVDGKWMNGGEIEGDPDCWTELTGSFRFETKPESVLLYVQGPSAGVDLMVANLHIFAVDRAERFAMLKAQTEKVRKRDVVILVKGKNGQPLSDGVVKVEQKTNSFPLGSCITRYALENEQYKEFFLKTFNWAVFENELKWYWTEKERNKLNYNDAEELCSFCLQYGIPMRGHCIFWETDDAVQNWIKALDQGELATAVEKRIVDLVSRFRGKFQHYDVNNEMLHGSFFRDRLGAQILPYMFQATHQFDPSAKLFVNDYHVEDGCDARASPEKYIEQVRELQAMGAPVHGIGLQGHLCTPIGAIIGNALDKLAMVGLPIWFTELDVSSSNDYIRADDLEVVLREAYAHPAVEGVMLWGFWETMIHREDAHLVNGDGTINEAGKALIKLKQEWTSNFEGKTNKAGCFSFRGYHGTYSVTVDTGGKMIRKQFLVENGDIDLVIDVQI